MALILNETAFTAPTASFFRMNLAHKPEFAMDVHTRHAQVQLNAQRPMRLSAAQGIRLRSVSGTAWITIDDDLRDLVLTPGQEWTVDSSRRVLITPLGRDSVRLDLCQASAPQLTGQALGQASADWLRRLTQRLHFGPANVPEAWA